jgi:hypothetical protein
MRVSATKRGAALMTPTAADGSSPIGSPVGKEQTTKDNSRPAQLKVTLETKKSADEVIQLLMRSKVADIPYVFTFHAADYELLNELLSHRASSDSLWLQSLGFFIFGIGLLTVRFQMNHLFSRLKSLNESKFAHDRALSTSKFSLIATLLSMMSYVRIHNNQPSTL